MTVKKKVDKMLSHFVTPPLFFRGKLQVQIEHRYNQETLSIA